jgi:hypothetical protein
MNLALHHPLPAHTPGSNAQPLDAVAGHHFPSRAHDFDCPAAWARLMIFGEFEPPQRKYAAGAAYLRGQGQGRVKITYESPAPPPHAPPPSAPHSG